MKKTVISLILVSLFVGALFFASFWVSRASASSLKGLPDYMVANELLYQSFPTRDDGTWVYPPDFAGTYIEEEILYVMLTDLSDDITSQYDRLLGHYKDSVRYVKVIYSLEVLSNLVRSAAEYLMKNGCSVSGYYPDPSRSKAVIEMDEADLPLAEKLIQQYGNTEWLELKKGYGPLIFTTVTLRGGDTVISNNGAVTIGRTLGVCGSYNNNLGFVTCGHGSLNYPAVYKGNTNIGTVVTCSFPPMPTASNPSTSSSGDYAIVKTNGNTNNQGSVWISGDTSSITPVAGYINGVPAQGLSLARYGATTQYGTATVNNPYYSWTISISSPLQTFIITIHNIVRATVNSVPDQSGDSGGPYFFPSSSTGTTHLFFCGVHSGHDSAYMYFTAYGIIYNNTSFIPAINGS